MNKAIERYTIEKLDQRIEHVLKTASSLEKYGSFEENYSDVKLSDMENFAHQTASLVEEVMQLRAFFRKYKEFGAAE